jgi:hypothetical protein
MAPKARLDKTGRRVICGECATYLAKVVEFHRMVPGERRTYRCVGFPAGWIRRDEDGVWTLSRHAAGKRRWSHAASFRRMYQPLQDLAQRWGMGQPNVPVHDLPAEAVCHGCRTRQVLDPEVLGVEPWPRPG